MLQYHASRIMRFRRSIIFRKRPKPFSDLFLFVDSLSQQAHKALPTSQHTNPSFSILFHHLRHYGTSAQHHHSPSLERPRFSFGGRGGTTVDVADGDEVGSTVVVSLEDNVLKLVFDGDNDDPAEYGADLKLADQKELADVKNSSGRKPRGPNVRALLNCEGGTLRFEGTEYTIQKEPMQVEGKQPNGRAEEKFQQSKLILFVLVYLRGCAVQ